MRLAHIAPAVAATLLVACHNGSNNQRDTTGMPNTSAAGSAAAPPTAGAIPTDTTHRDSIRDATKKKP